MPHSQKIEWPDQCHFFLTVSTALHYPYFQEPEQKSLVLESIKYLKVKWRIPIEAYAILINHIHLMFYAKHGRQASSVKRFLQSNISREYKKRFPVKYKNFWQSIRVLWIYPRDEVYWAVMGYIIGNLLKHREVNTFNELYDDSFCSFQYIADKYGFDFACNIVRNAVAVPESADAEVKLEDFKGCAMQPLSRAW